MIKNMSRRWLIFAIAASLFFLSQFYRVSNAVIVTGSIGIVLTIIFMAIMPVDMPLFAFGLLFFGFGFFNATGVLMYPHIKELMPAEMSGAAMTGINFFTMIGPAIFLQGLGMLMQTLYPATSRRPEAFHQLKDAVKNENTTGKIILFFDELPWLVNKKSSFVEALSYLWNRFPESDPRIILIVCGSAASWMISNIVDSRGGLYNRITRRLSLQPFN